MGAWSLQARLLIAVFSVTFITWLVVAISGYYDTKRELNELLDAHLAQSAAMVISRLETDDSGEIELEHVGAAHRYQRRLAYQVWDSAGRLRLRSLSAPTMPLSQAGEGFSNADIAGQRWRVYSVTVTKNAYTIHVGELLDARIYVQNEVIEHLLLPLLFALPLLGLLLAIAIKHSLRPLRTLASAVEQREASALEPLTTSRVPKEALPLVRQLNALFQRITKSMESERRFTGDAAHELRTPVAAIRTHAQVASHSVDDSERSRALKQVIAGCDRITHLIEQLLTLARLDSGKSATIDSACDLEAVVQTVLADIAHVAYDKGVELELTAAGSAQVRGNEALLKVLARNLIDNAVRYSGSDSKVVVNFDNTQDHIVMSVSDQGPGIASELKERVFARFFRVTGSKETGSGLGLSIVSRIVELHGATVHLHDAHPGPGLEVTVSFPTHRTRTLKV